MNDKICFYSAPYPRVKSYFDMIDEAVAHGLSAIECFCMFELSDPDVRAAEKIKEYADSKGIRISCLSVYAKYAFDMVDRLKGYADVASALGSPYLHHTIADEFVNPDTDKDRWEELFYKGVSAVREVYDYAESIGIKAIYEDQSWIFNGVAGFKRFLSEVDRDVGVVADFGNIYQSSNTIYDFLEAFAHRVCHVHIKDVTVTPSNPKGTGNLSVTGEYMNEVEIGTGIIDFKKGIDMLKSAGYNGYYALEYGASDDNSDKMKKALKLVDSWL